MKINLKKINASGLKSVLQRNTSFSKTCKICNLEFPDEERTKKHMLKAHSKPRREKEY